jgi:hypothetical protein
MWYRMCRSRCVMKGFVLRTCCRTTNSVRTTCNTLLSQAGIATGNIQVVASLVVIFLVLVTYMHKWWSKVPLTVALRIHHVDLGTRAGRLSTTAGPSVSQTPSVASTVIPSTSRSVVQLSPYQAVASTVSPSHSAALLLEQQPSVARTAAPSVAPSFH